MLGGRGRLFPRFQTIANEHDAPQSHRGARRPAAEPASEDKGSESLSPFRVLQHLTM